MKESVQTLEIPLLSFTMPVERFPLEGVHGITRHCEKPTATKQSIKPGSTPRSSLEVDCRESESFPVIRVKDSKIAAGCYGLKIEDESMAPVLQLGMVAVFSQDDDPALGDIFSIGRKGELPLMRKVVKNEVPPDGKTGSVPQKGRVRKSFMTPTPLHIPESRISPIAESTHQMIYFKNLAQPEELTLLPAGNLLWMHPLVLILPRGKF